MYIRHLIRDQIFQFWVYGLCTDPETALMSIATGDRLNLILWLWKIVKGDTRTPCAFMCGSCTYTTQQSFGGKSVLRYNQILLGHFHLGQRFQ